MSSKTRTILIAVGAIIAIVLFAGWATGFFSSAPEGSGSVTGAVNYRRRIALPDNAVVVVQLRDISEADSTAIILDQRVIEKPGQVPIPFEVHYNPDDIDESRTYSIFAQIMDGEDNLLFTTTQAYPVITQGNPTANVEVLVEPLG